MSRRQRQVDALHDLCRVGAVARAVDLAFEHFAAFGSDEAIVELLAEAVRHVPNSDDIAQRLAELRSSGS